MSSPLAEDEPPLDPEAARILSRVRWLMLVSGITTMVAIAAVIGVIGYRVFKSGGSADPGAVTAMLPKGARIVATAVTGERLVVTLDVGGATEIRTYDLETLKPTGQLRFANEP